MIRESTTREMTYYGISVAELVAMRKIVCRKLEISLMQRVWSRLLLRLRPVFGKRRLRDINGEIDQIAITTIRHLRGRMTAAEWQGILWLNG